MTRDVTWREGRRLMRDKRRGEIAKKERRGGKRDGVMTTGAARQVIKDQRRDLRGDDSHDKRHDGSRQERWETRQSRDERRSETHDERCDQSHDERRGQSCYERRDNDVTRSDQRRDYRNLTKDAMRDATRTSIRFSERAPKNNGSHLPKFDGPYPRSTSWVTKRWSLKKLGNSATAAIAASNQQSPEIALSNPAADDTCKLKTTKTLPQLPGVATK